MLDRAQVSPVNVPRELYPFESHFLDLDGIRYHYLDEGQGEPVVMVHGNPTWSFYYRRLVSALRKRFRCIVPDHVGCGLSDKPPLERYPYTLSRRVADLDTLLSHLELTQKLTLVLHDWGGMIGMALAHRHPERIRRLVILNTGAFHLPRSKSFPIALRLCRGPLGAFLVRRLNLFARLASHVGCHRQVMPREVRRGFLAPYDSWENRIAIHRFVVDIPLSEGDPGYDLVTEVAAGLERFQHTPMLILWGEKDFVFDRSFLEEWTRRFPEAETHAFPDCGHYVLEDAFDDILADVERFLATR